MISTKLLILSVTIAMVSCNVVTKSSQTKGGGTLTSKAKESSKKGPMSSMSQQMKNSKIMPSRTMSQQGPKATLCMYNAPNATKSANASMKGANGTVKMSASRSAQRSYWCINGSVVATHMPMKSSAPGGGVKPTPSGQGGSARQTMSGKNSSPLKSGPGATRTMGPVQTRGGQVIKATPSTSKNGQGGKPTMSGSRAVGQVGKPTMSGSRAVVIKPSQTKGGGNAGSKSTMGTMGSKTGQLKPTPGGKDNTMKSSKKTVVGTRSLKPSSTMGVKLKPQPPAKSKSELTKEKQEKAQGKIAGRDPKVKEGLDNLSKAKTEKEVLEALTKATKAAKEKIEEKSDYEKRSMALTMFKSAKGKEVGSKKKVIEAMDELALSLDTKEYKTLDKDSLLALLAIGNQARNTSKKSKLSTGAQRIILERLLKLIVEKKDLTEDLGKKMWPLKDVIAEHKALKQLPLAMIKGILSILKDLEMDCNKKAPLILSVYLGKVDLSKFATEILPRFGRALCFLSSKLLKKVPQDSIKTEEHVKLLCNSKWSSSQVRIITNLAMKQTSFNDVTKFDCVKRKVFKNCWAGVSTKDFKKIVITKSDMDCFSTTVLPSNLRNILAQKIREAAGSLKNLGAEDVKKVIAAAGVSTKDIKQLSKAVLKSVSNEIEKKIKENAISNPIAVKVAAKLILSAKVNDSSFKLAKLPAKLLKGLPLSNIKDIPVEKLGFSANDTSSSDDGDDEIEPVGLSLSSVIIGKLKKKYGGFNASVAYWRKTLTRAKKFCCGFLPKDVNDMPNDLIKDFVSECKNVGYKCSSLVGAVGKRYEEVVNSEGNEVITEADLSVVGKFLPGVSLKLLLKITDDTDTRKIAIGFIRSSCAEKIYSKKRLETLAEMALAMLKITSGTQISSDTIDTLGCLVAYLKIKIVKEIPDDVAVDRAEVMGQYEFDDEHRKEFVTKIKRKHAKNNDVSNGLSNIGASELEKYIPLIFKALSKADIEKIPKDVLNDNILPIAKIDISRDAAEAVNAKVSSSSSARRKRRAAANQDLSAKTAAGIVEMGSLLYGLNAASIKTITDEVFKEALDTIGKLSGHSAEQLQAWVFVLKRAYGSIASITDTDLKRLKYLILGMETADINSLTLNNTEVISVFSGISGYNASQSKAMYDEIKEDLKRASINLFSGEELSASGHFLKESSHTDLGKVSTTTYKEASKDLGEIDGWSQDHMNSLKTLAVSSYGAVSSWQASELRDVGAAIGGATTAELQSISSSIFSVIKPVAIKQMPVALFKELSVQQISAMTSDQFAAVTQEQKNSLPSEKNSAFVSASGANQTINTSALLENEVQPSQPGSSSSIANAGTATVSATPSYYVAMTSAGGNNNVTGCNEWEGTCNAADAKVPTMFSLFFSLASSILLMVLSSA